MHDERKVKGDVDEKVKEQTRQLIAKFREVYADVFQQKAEGNMNTSEVIKKIDALLELNPELYTVFNYRRQLLLAGWELAAKQEKEEAAAAAAAASSSTSPADGSAAEKPTFISAKQKQQEDMEREIKLNTKILLKDYKVYSAWLHRRWLFMRMGNTMKQMFLSKERQQCEALLNVDERNFHAWGYRRWVLNEQRRLANLTAAADGSAASSSSEAINKGIADAQNEAERTFTLAKIERNISNFSAWHNRALIFVERLASVGLVSEELMAGVGRSGVVETIRDDPALVEEVIGSVVDDMMVDVELAVKAFYNDPDDQSTWLYAERLVALLAYASDVLTKARPEGGDEESPSTYAIRNDLLDASKGSTTVTVSADAALLLAECLASCVGDLEECCTSLRTEALRNGAAISKGLKGIQWPTWLLLHLPNAVEEAATRAQYWEELSVVDPQRRGYYADMAAAEGKQ